MVIEFLVSSGPATAAMALIGAITFGLDLTLTMSLLNSDLMHWGFMVSLLTN